MNRQQLIDLQTPLKELYKSFPEEAIALLRAKGIVDVPGLTCRLDRPPGSDDQIIAGLHPKAGGTGAEACSGDMLLQSLVSCAGVTFAAVATAMSLEIRHAEIEATGIMDFRGTLGVNRDVPVGITSIDVTFRVDSVATPEQLEKLLQLVERYCVVFQTLRAGTAVTVRMNRG